MLLSVLKHHFLCFRGCSRETLTASYPYSFHEGKHEAEFKKEFLPACITHIFSYMHEHMQKQINVLLLLLFATQNRTTVCFGNLNSDQNYDAKSTSKCK